ncbi:conserved membrane hypothetical protein [uncultured Alphaproteobacteria bacterium]|uniref:TRAP transporter small permease protein n=1 Tax=uncultured Alphaproteobacteria bacterium TaxID=91750 RepID=A0A212KJA7_9PROT|nr:conserved membrane hypothetical protein [uncultured Alphaproteobacteria bacterium]
MRHLGKIWTYAAAATLAALVLVTVAAVVMRYAFSQPIQWTEEISGLLMIWIVMTGAIAAERDNQHLAIPLLADLLPRRGRIALDLLVAVASVALLAVMGRLAWQLAARAQYKLTQILGISWFWIDVAVTFGCAGMAVYTLLRVARELKDGEPR